jgi:pimeloyl-ACP methyl ester carboxylesterase
MENKIQHNKTYILIHGAWHTSECWDELKCMLENKGHQVFSPDLPGHGKDKTPFQQISLTTYVNSILSLINIINRPVILVGHSMAGIIISQLAEEIPDKIEQLIYIAAFIPNNNESLSIEASKSASKGISTEMLVDPNKNEIELRLSNKIKDLFFNTCDTTLAEKALFLLQKEPLSPFNDFVTLSEKRYGKVKKKYIECLQDNAVSVNDQQRMYSKILCDVTAIDCDHSPFYSATTELLKAILDYE